MKKFDICIIGGCGHVGLPLALVFADKGKKVVIYDKNERSISMIASGKMPFFEEGGEELLTKVLQKGSLSLSADPAVISDSGSVVMVIGTPVDEHLNPEFRIVKESVDEISPYLDDDQLLILRSTVYPGMTKRIGDWLAEKNKKPGIAFCPERILEGKAIEEISSLPQIVSALDKDAEKKASDLFKLITDKIIITQTMEAELAKLYSNVYRYIRFAISNQFYTIANDYGLDFYNIYEAMTYDYPRCKDFPRPGFAAGPCLFKDTMQLGAFNNDDFGLGHSAMLINEGLPYYIFKKLKEQYVLSDLTVGILGMSFKSESDDIRESLSYKLKKISEFEAKKTLCSDPFVRDDSFVSEEELTKESDIIIIATPHRQYKDLKIEKEKKTVDIWNILGNGGKI